MFVCKPPCNPVEWNHFRDREPDLFVMRTVTHTGFNKPNLMKYIKLSRQIKFFRRNVELLLVLVSRMHHYVYILRFI